METIIISLLSSVSSVSLISVLAYLSRNWIAERLKASIKFEYDSKLEAYKSQIVRREQAYEEIIGSLYDMIKYLRIHKEDYGQGTGLSNDREGELLQEYVSASSALNKATDIGSFYVSEDAVNILQILRERKQLEYSEPRFEFYEHEYQTHHSALGKILKIAREDLKRT